MSGRQATVDVRPVAGTEDLDAFVDFPRSVYADDPFWVPTIRPEVRKQLDRDRNPYYRRASRELFLARIDGRVVGTVAAILDGGEVDTADARTGFFGFFETIDNPAVATALIDAVRTWMRERGVRRLRGPVNGTPNEAAGVLVEGHDSSPSIWHGHTPPYYATLLEALGLDVSEEQVAYLIETVDLALLPEEIRRVAERARRRPGVVVRRVDESAWDRDVEIAHRLYVDSHATIPGHRGMDREVFTRVAGSLRRVLEPDLALLVEVDGEPAGFSVTIPDINQALLRTSGRMHAWDLIKLAWYARRIRTASCKLIGVLPRFRRRGLEALLILETANGLVSNGYQRVEISLVSSHNPMMMRTVQRMPVRAYRRYRIYETDL